MKDMFSVTEEIKEAGAGLVSLDGAIDTSDSSPCKELLWQLLSSIAEFERKLIFSRCKEGRARAKKSGKHLGRHSSTTKAQDEQMRLAYEQGQSYAQIGQTFGLSRMREKKPWQGGAKWDANPKLAKSKTNKWLVCIEMEKLGMKLALHSELVVAPYTTGSNILSLKTGWMRIS